MENAEQMRQRHKEELESLQAACSHKKTKRMPYMWAPGHYGNDVEVCEFCEKILKSYEIGSITSQDRTAGLIK